MARAGVTERTAIDIVRETTAEQGVPEKVQDEATLDLIASIVVRALARKEEVGA